MFWRATALTLCLALGLCAQTTETGTITGQIRGPGGVSVPGATVQIVELTTGERKVTWSDEAGSYRFSGVPVGTYRLEVSLIGFQTDVRQPVPVTAGQTIRVNIALLMAVPEQAASAPRARRRPMGSDQASGPPLAGQVGERPGAARSDSGLIAATETSENGSLRFSESGVTGSPLGETPEASADLSASAANSFLLSGTVAPALGEMGGPEFRRRSMEMRRGSEALGAPGLGGAAERGGGLAMGGGPGGFGMPGIRLGPGGGLWTGRRSGANRIRGGVSEEYSNSALNARPYPLNVPEVRQIPSFRQQMGFTLGGPLVIPRVYNGREKTSFFVNYGAGRSRQPFDSFATVPTAAERNGDFSQSVIPSGPFAGTVPAIFDPASSPEGPRTPFQDNQIPSSRLSAAAVGLLTFVPLPNLPGRVQNFHLQQGLPSSNDRVMGRLGHQMSSKDSINVAYFFNSSRADAVSSFPSLTRHSSARNQNLTVTESHTFNPRMVNTVMIGFNRHRQVLVNAYALREDIAGGLGIEGISNDPRDWGLPIVQFTNFTGLNDAIYSLTRNQTVRVADFFIWNVDKHNVRLGGEVRRVQLNTLTDPDARGTFTFTGFSTSEFNEGFPVAGTGFDFADFLLGLPQATSVRFGTSSNYFRSWVYSAFVQDDWRVSPRWTLNLGLRYEYWQPFTEKYGHLSNLAVGTGFSSASVVTGISPGSFPPSLVRDDRNNLATRVGVAFRPWMQRALVLRAGYALFDDGGIYQRLIPNLANQPPFAQASTLLTTPTRVLTLEHGFPEVSPTVARNTYAVDPNFRTPYAQTWNFGIDHEIARNVIISLGYVGIKGTKLDLLLAPNRAEPGSPLTTQDRLSIENALQFIYETSGAASTYHGVRLGIHRQFSSGFSAGGDYTFSKSLDNAGSVAGAGRTVAQNTFDLKAERGLSVFDVRHRLNLYHVYEFPFGERRRFLHRGGALARLFGNWQISGFATLQSGTPLTARVLGNASNNSGTGANFSERADATGLPVSLSGDARSVQRYFNTAAFSLPSPGRFGNAGRNTIPGPGTINFNMSLARQFTISREKGVLGVFRIEANNIFNTPNFSSLATVVNGAEYGRVTSVQPMRTLTFSLRVRL